MKRNKMKVLGITGGVGSGKTTLLSHFEKRYGARTIQADAVGRILMAMTGECYSEIKELFGLDILQEDLEIDRVKLGKIIFENEDMLKRINQIIHPAVKKHIIWQIEEERKKGMVPFVVIEAALLIEDNYQVICDDLWYIYASETQRHRRLKMSRDYTEEKIDSIFVNQLTEEEYKKNTSWVIDNSDDNQINTYKQIEKGLKEHGFL
jgi:dephospho-CoA kinase